jgi:dTDP-4-amino-4,6-dideoxygalactose transaminase
MRKPATSVRPVRSKERFLTFGRPTIEEPEIAEVVDSLKSCWLDRSESRGSRRTSPRTRDRRTRSRCFVHGGAAPLDPRRGPEAGDEVITTPLTFCAP